MASAGCLFRVPGNHEKGDASGVYLLRFNKKVIDIVVLCRNRGELWLHVPFGLSSGKTVTA